MKKNVRTAIMLMFAFAVMVFMAAMCTRPAFADTKVKGGSDSTSAPTIKINKTYTTHLSPEDDKLYFKFTAPAGDYIRMNTWLEIRDNSDDEGKFYAFFGSYERVFKPDHKKWDSEEYYGKDYPVLFCKPSRTYYLELENDGEHGVNGTITFCIRGETDDSDNSSEEGYLNTPFTLVTLSSTIKANIDTKSNKKKYDLDWFSFTPKEDGIYKVVFKMGEVESRNEKIETFNLKFQISNPYTLENYIITDENSTGSKLIRLDGNRTYEICVSVFHCFTKDGKEIVPNLNYPLMYAPYTFRIDPSDESIEEDKDLTFGGKNVGPCKKISPGTVFKGWIYGDGTDSDSWQWYSLKTTKAGDYRFSLYRYTPSLVEFDAKCDLVCTVYDSGEKKLGSFTVKTDKTGVYTLNLKKNAQYYISIYPTNYDLTDTDSEYLDWYYDEEEDEWYLDGEWDEVEDLHLDAPFYFRADLMTTVSWDKATVSYTKKWTYAGKAVEPTVKVVYGGKTLRKGKDYTVSYKNNTKPGKGSLTIKLVRTYRGNSKSFAFSIYPKKQVISSLKSTKAKKATIKIKKDSTVAGYQISYSLTSNFKKAKTVTTTAVSKTFTLTTGKTYYFRVRGIAKYGSKEIYGAWSATKKVKVK